MSSPPDEGWVSPTGGPGRVLEDVDDDAAIEEHAHSVADTSDGDHREGPKNRLLEYLQEAREEGGETNLTNGTTFRKFKATKEVAEESELSPGVPHAPGSITSGSTPDDTPSLHGSITSSSFAGAALNSPRFSPSPSFRPFDRRFQSRLQPGSPALSPSLRAVSPSQQLHTRTPSFGSRFENVDVEHLDGQSAPWDVVRWTKLQKVTSQVFSEAGRRSFGNPTCVVVSATIAVGTDKGLILVFDYSQMLKSIIGSGTKGRKIPHVIGTLLMTREAVECGPITGMAVSADHTAIAGGHATGHIFTWELTKPVRPFLHIPPLGHHELDNRKSDGHVEGAAVVHLGFLGTRRTALVSADDRGMAFSHLATRGLGAMGRMVKTTRVLGRYPTDAGPAGRPRKPSSVLGLSILPLGGSPERTDSMGLVAMLTPYLLVIVSTTPVAQTQYKTVRPKEVASESALSGCLAWYPSVKLKKAAPSEKPQMSRAKLVYVWSNILTILELSIVESEEEDDPDRPPTLEFKPVKRFRCEEAIVAVQWINKQIIGALTITQRLLIIDESTLYVSEKFDLMPKHILHRDLFSSRLQPLVDRVDEEGSSHHHIADAFYSSFKAYKGRIFLLCNYQMSVGALSNWADRLLAMMEMGDFIGAIRLATTYYTGNTNKLTIALPEDPQLRHPMVEEKLIEMIAASLRYAFGKNKSKQNQVLERAQLQDFAGACFEACIAMNREDFLMEQMFECFEQSSTEAIFLDILEPHILEERISFVPPIIVKALIAHYTSLDLESRLEEIICHMDTRTLDIDQVTSLCKKHHLYDALIYVWNRALSDYITPTMELLRLVLPLCGCGNAENSDSMETVNALKLFPYLAYILTGRVYPTGEELPEPEASNAKAQIYYLLFLGQTVTWPKKYGKPFLTTKSLDTEPSFPYLRLILQFDAASFLSALNEAFEDNFLNGGAETLSNGDNAEEDQVFGRSVNRQYIVSILLEVLGPEDFPIKDTVYLDMFIARNLPKYPQFILLSGSALHRVLVGLCNPPDPDIAEDCQLSVEYLLTVYRPPEIKNLLEHFSRAGYYRVLKSIFRSEKQYARLLSVHFDDEESLEAVFDCIAECLRPRSGLTAKQTEEVKAVIIENARKLFIIDQGRAARIIDSYAASLHHTMLAAVEDKPHDQFVYLQAILEPTAEAQLSGSRRPEAMNNPESVEAYIRLMCEYDPERVSEYISHLQSGDLRLQHVLPAMENTGVMDAAVVLMAREGQIRQAMDRLLSHLKTLRDALLGVLNSSKRAKDINLSNEAAEKTLESLQKYARVGVWLCQGQMKTAQQQRQIVPVNRRDRTSLTPEELLWLDLIDFVVGIAKDCISEVKTFQTNGTSTAIDEYYEQLDFNMLTVQLRKFVQDTFSALLTATSNSQTTSFLHVLRGFLSRASLSSPSLADLRNVLRDVFETYMYEDQLLSLAGRLLSKDLFVHVNEAVTLRQRGWRPIGQSCEACGKRVWGPGAAGGIYSAWEKTRLEQQRAIELAREQRRLEADGSVSAVARGKSKARAQPSADPAQPGEGATADTADEQNTGELVVFSCRHTYHKGCVEKLQSNQRPSSQEWTAFRCMACGHQERKQP